jgi:hypothetical protein
MLVGKDPKEPNAGEGQKETGTLSKASPVDLEPETTKKIFLDITTLIRSVQRAEGNSDCFRRGIRDCDQPDCKWRSFCLEGQQVLNQEETYT